MCKRLVCLAFACVLALASTAGADLVGWWTLDEETGAVVNDSSGNGINGSFVGNPQWAPGFRDGALQFDGASWVDLGFPAKTAIAGTLSIACWVNPDKLGPILLQDRGFVARDAAYVFKASGNKIRFTTPGVRDHTSTNGTLRTGTWQHVAITFQAEQAGGAIFYLDGVETDRVDASKLPAGNGPFRIANNQFANQFFIGTIDDVRLYDHILTPDEVRQLALRTKAYDPVPADKTFGYPQPLLQWKAGGTALVHNVYLGTSPELTQADLVGPSVPGPMFFHVAGLTPGVTYYWRVDEVEADMATIHPGDVWSFTATPESAWGPKPADGLTYVASDAMLEWSPGTGALGHDVYMGADRAAIEAGAAEARLAEKQTPASFTPAALEQGKTYYWRVDEVKADGSKVAGPVWSFTVRPVIAVGDPNLVGWWKLDDENSGTAVDSSGRDNYGAIQGPTWVPGRLGDALAFDGVDDSVDCGAATSLNTLGSVTVAAWVKLGALGVDRKIMSNQNNSTGGFKLGVYTNNKVELEIRTSANAGTLNRTIAGGTVFEAGVWYHVAGVYSQGQFIRTYVNGILDREMTTPNVMGVSTGPLRLGRESYNTAYWWLGLMDDVRVYNKALTDAEIQAAMQGNPLVAQDPRPGNGVNVDIDGATELSWSAGATAAEHDVYFGADRDAVKAADPGSALYKGRQAGTMFSLDGLVEFGGGAYFWRIDEVEAGGAAHKGNIWTFTVPGYLIADEFESYTDADGNRIYQAWIDGYATQTSGSTVGNVLAPFAERSIVHGGRQSMPMDYNNIGAPYYFSEAEVEFAPARDWTTNGVTDLSLWFRGHPEKFVETAPGSYTISSTSGDISGAADNFRFVCKQLNGDGSIAVKVNSITNTAPWAKAGVMVRETLDAGSPRGHMIVTPSGRRAFENRTVAAGPSFSAYGAVNSIALPYWVKIERKGTDITAYHSADGVNWVKQPDNENTGANRSPNPQIIPMSATVYIGLLVTSNNLATPCFAEFSDLTTTGDITGSWQIADIGANKGNDRDNLYAAVEDSSGRIATVVHPDRAAITTVTWTEWTIPLSSFAGVDLAKVEKLYLGVGSPTGSTPSGAGRIYFDDIRVTQP